ncbi:MAG: helix-turn-helix domain-containing protein [Candidatus Sulfotelmatobacter sp.]
MHILDCLIAAPQKDLSPLQQLKLYREFLGLTQAQLAAAMGTTQTSVARWESGSSPISVRTMGHVRALVTANVGEEIRGLFAVLVPRLALCDFNGLCGVPRAEFTNDNKGNLYLGTVFIDGYRKHSLHFRIDNRQWYGLDREGRAAKVDGIFLKSIVQAAKASKMGCRRGSSGSA